MEFLSYTLFISALLFLIPVLIQLKNQKLIVRQLSLENSALSLKSAIDEEKAANLLTEKFNITSHLKEEQNRLLDELQQLRDKLSEANQSLEGARVYYKTQQERNIEQKAEIESLQLKFSKEFELIAAKILDEKTLKFTDVNKSNLDLLLNPLKENIKAFEEKIEKVYKAESDERNMLKGELGKLIQLNQQISQEAHNLTKALKADTKKQGNWGEFVLDRILELSGLISGESYTKQSSYTDENGNRLQPDIVITLPDNKHIIVDSKVSLVTRSSIASILGNVRLMHSVFSPILETKI